MKTETARKFAESKNRPSNKSQIDRPENLGKPFICVYLDPAHFASRLSRERALTLLKVELDAADFRDGR